MKNLIKIYVMIDVYLLKENVYCESLWRWREKEFWLYMWRIWEKYFCIVYFIIYLYVVVNVVLDILFKGIIYKGIFD